MAHDPEHDCSHLREALGEYLDGEIDSELCRELREHLKDCERCQVVVDTTHRTIRFYSEQKPYRLPEGMLERLQQKLRPQSAPNILNPSRPSAHPSGEPHREDLL